MSDYGFGDDDDVEATKPPAKLTLKSDRKRVAPETLQKAADSGADIGFVSREPKKRSSEKPAPRRPGRRQTEPQDKFLVTGPKRVLDAFKVKCDERGVPYWRMIEELMETDDSENS